MQRISTWQAMQPFAGKLIGFQSSSWSLLEGCWLLSPEQPLLFGVVSAEASRWQRYGQGYNLNRLILPTAVPHNNALTDSLFERFEFACRLATLVEMAQIQNRVNEGVAKLEYMAPIALAHLLTQTQALTNS